MAEATHKITTLTEGMLELDNVMMGMIEIEPREILVDGLRKELCKCLALMLHKEFIFATEHSGRGNTGAGGQKIQGGMGAFGDYEEKFERLRNNFVGLKRAIEFISDFLNVQGEKIWREELGRIIELAVEKEATRLVNKKYQSSIDNIEDGKYYIPEFDPVDENDFTFMGRLLRHILGGMGKGFYLDNLSTWYDQEGLQIWGLRFIHFLHENLGTQFLQGFD